MTNSPSLPEHRMPRTSWSYVVSSERAPARAYWLAAFAFITVASEMLETIFPSFYRHLVPFYFSAILFLVYSPRDRFSSTTNKALPAWLIALQLLGWLVAVMAVMSNFLQDALADACRLFFIFFSVALFWKLRLCAREKKIILGGAVLGAVFFLVQLLSVDPLGRLTPLVFSVLMNRNLIGSVLLSGLFSTILLYWLTDSDEKGLRVLLIGAAAVLIYFILISISRSTILTGLTSLLVLTVYRTSSRKMRLTLLAIILSGVIVTLYLPDYYADLSLDKTANLEQFSSGRMDIWNAIIRDLPQTNFLGVGTGNLREVLRDDRQFLSSGYGRFHRNVGSPHSLPLKVLLENGILGLLGYAIFLAGMFRFCHSLKTISLFPFSIALFCVVFTLFHDYTMAPWLIFAISLPMRERDEAWEFCQRQWINIPQSAHHSRSSRLPA